MEFIIACDLEGIHGVVGEPNKTLTDSADYKIAIEGAVAEINTAARALFDGGATKVLVWDNHGANNNIDFSKLDPRITPVYAKGDARRWDFAKAHDPVGVVFLGYHAMEGAFRGVLAHTMNSKAIQYAKLNGVAFGELYVDTRICASLGIKPLFHAGDDISVSEMNVACPTAETVVTKIGLGRNRAELRPEAEVLEEIYAGVSRALSGLDEPYSCPLPAPAELEVRYTRAERAEIKYARALEEGIGVRYGEDTHVLFLDIRQANEIPLFL